MKIKEIFRAVGLKLVCTICDQGSTTQAAINALIQQTKAHRLRNKN